VARKAQAAQFAANVLPIIRDIQAAGHTVSTPSQGSSTLGRLPPLMVGNGGMCQCGRF
jgi:hypothetical protein